MPHAPGLALPYGQQTNSRSPSPYSSRSDEADDELSESSSLLSRTIMRSPARRRQRRESSPPPAYLGEDTRPTSKKELLGFYTYSFAAEVFVVCGLGAFIPITLEDLARASSTAVLAGDHSKPCRAKEVGIPDALNAFANEHHKHGSNQCVFRFFGAEVNTASFAMYTFSLSVLLQALFLITMSGAADHGQYRKKLLLGFAAVGAVATMLFLFVTPGVYLLGSLWAIVGNVCVGASFVLLNSFLPLMVRYHPTVLYGYEGDGEVSEDGYHESEHSSQEPAQEDVIDATTALLPSAEQSTPYPQSPSMPSAEMQLATQISAYGMGIGYIAAVIVQILSVIILKTTGATLFSLRLVLFTIGLWWLCFTIPAALYLRPRPGPPLSYGAHNTPRTWSTYLTHSWTSLARTILRARQLKDILLFLTAWFMISDAVATISGTAILFAKTTLSMSPSALALINVIVTLSGIVGAFTWSKISRLMQLSPSQTIVSCIVLFELIPLYGLLGYIPAIQRLGVFGLQQQWEMYPVGAVYGLVLGGLGAYCRALFGELIPPGSEAAFYALYALTDKGSSVFGPAVVGAITDAYGEIRPAFLFLAVLIGLPIPLMIMVDVRRGKEEAGKLGRELVGLDGERRGEHLEHQYEDI